MFKDSGFQYPKVKTMPMAAIPSSVSNSASFLESVLLDLPADGGGTAAAKKSAPAIAKRKYTKKKSEVPANKRKRDDDDDDDDDEEDDDDDDDKDYKPTGDKRNNNKGNKRQNKKQALAKSTTNKNADSGATGGGGRGRKRIQCLSSCNKKDQCRSDDDSKRNLLVPELGKAQINGALESKAAAAPIYAVFDETLFPDKIYDFFIPADLEDTKVLLLGELYDPVINNDQFTSRDFDDPLNFNDDPWISTHYRKQKKVTDDEVQASENGGDQADQTSDDFNNPKIDVLDYDFNFDDDFWISTHNYTKQKNITDEVQASDNGGDQAQAQAQAQAAGWDNIQEIINSILNEDCNANINEFEFSNGANWNNDQGNVMANLWNYC